MNNQSPNSEELVAMTTFSPKPKFLDTTKPNVLVIVTGGTICMTYTGINDSLRPGPLADVLRGLPEVQDESLPYFDILEWRELIDSSDINLAHWVRLARNIEERYHNYDGFVVLHGTDTLAYTASALSFMLENLHKPVVLTGSMLPLCHIQTDAKRNLAVAMMVSGYSQIAEVAILFGRGNRARKLDCSVMDAFDTPNFPALGRVGVDLIVNDQLLLSPGKRGFHVFPHFCMNIVVVAITPGFHSTLLRHLFSSPTRPLAVMLQLYGSGTAPMSDPLFLDTIQLGIRQGVEILCLTQCPSGTCSLLTYENGAHLYQLGVIEGKDLTPEAALAKLAYLMGKGYAGQELRMLMERDIRGEITEEPLKLTGQVAMRSSVRFRSRDCTTLPSVASPVKLQSQIEFGSTKVGELTQATPIPIVIEEEPEVGKSLAGGEADSRKTVDSTDSPDSNRTLRVKQYSRDRSRTQSEVHRELCLRISTLQAELAHYGRAYYEVADNKPQGEVKPAETEKEVKALAETDQKETPAATGTESAS